MMKEYPLVSILIPLYNAEEYFSETMESLLVQTYKNIEIIIVNDGSTDNSLKIARQYEKENKHIKVYSQENSGAQVARNKAFQISKGTYIQYFDADDIMHPDKIASQMEVLREHGFQNDIVATGKWMTFFNSIDNAVLRERVICKDYNDIFLFFNESLENGEVILGQVWLIPRAINKRVGNWNIGLSRFQDIEFFMRIAYHANKILFVKESMVYYRKGLAKSITSDSTSDKAKQSILEVFDSYYRLLKNDLDKYSLRKGIAGNYSFFYQKYFPLDKRTKEQVYNRLKSLGYDQPIVEFSQSYLWIIKIIGIDSGLKLRRLKLKFWNKVKN